ncbi:hypothetical protein GGR53DRAFT_461226 [Hypoxylon sp. FL1150]|nr:hypothetical protein GGR53DRAFT_461226 [Hypoxylon sp. FL1150]
MANKPDAPPPAYGEPPQHPQPAYQGGYPPQSQYYGNQQQGYYQPNPNMGYYQQQQGPPPQGPYPGGAYPAYPPQQGAYYQQGRPPQGYYQHQNQGSSADGCLGALLGALACCCCLDFLF